MRAMVGVGDVQTAVRPLPEPRIGHFLVVSVGRIVERQVPGPSSITIRSGKVRPPSADRQTLTGARHAPDRHAPPEGRRRAGRRRLPELVVKAMRAGRPKGPHSPDCRSSPTGRPEPDDGPIEELCWARLSAPGGSTSARHRRSRRGRLVRLAAAEESRVAVSRQPRPMCTQRSNRRGRRVASFGASVEMRRPHCRDCRSTSDRALDAAKDRQQPCPVIPDDGSGARMKQPRGRSR